MVGRAKIGFLHDQLGHFACLASSFDQILDLGHLDPYTNGFSAFSRAFTPSSFESNMGSHGILDAAACAPAIAVPSIWNIIESLELTLTVTIIDTSQPFIRAHQTA